MRKIIAILFVFQSLMIVNCYAQKGDVWMHPNAGQWDEHILYKIDLKSGWMYLEQGRFVFHMTNLGDIYGHKHDHDAHQHEDHGSSKKDSVKWHVVQQTFLGANLSVKTNASEKSLWYKNYFLGKDQSKWKSNLYAAQKLNYPDFYDGIDLIVETNEQVKYSFIVKPNVNASLIKYKYIGADKVWIDKAGKLHMRASLGEVIEEAPTAWTIDENGKKTKVDAAFKIVNKAVTFELGQYNPNETLVIDPFLSFSTFTGSTADNWGYTATPGTDGSLFAGGIVFSAGYPITAGAFQSSFAGGDFGTAIGLYNFSIDIGITKFNSTGTAMLYSTLLGGNGNETPNSIVTNNLNELFVMGTTSSTNFPVNSAAYNQTKSGGFSIEGGGTTGNEINFNNGTDIFVTRFNAAGTAILGSTYVGGSGNDGISLSSVLAFNYGDPFRGEIIVDQSSNVYVSTSSNSFDFPTTAGADQTYAGGATDAVIFKLNPTLSTLIWSTYFGSNGDETGNSIQLNSVGAPYIGGGTTSGGTSLGFLGGHQATYSGIGDGYVIKLNPANGAFDKGTYIGTSGYDQTYFVQIDNADNVFALGQSEGNMAITAGKYGNPNSGQFIRKLNANLTSALYTTVLGNSNGRATLSPTAFLVSNCGDIYVTGWGGIVNVQNSIAVNSTSAGFPTTPDAFQLNTNGNNFWIAVLTADATILKYASYMGGVASSNNHVDGGTSRFDKNGTIYHAVCAACGGQNLGFTTTPGVVAGQNLSNNCNLAAWKFELSTIVASVGAPDPVICIPDDVFFDNNSSNGNTFQWDFGDGTGSTELNPTHSYTLAGSYTVTLVVADSNNCFTPDTLQFPINLSEFAGGVVLPATPVCPGDSFAFEAFGGTNYVWTPANVLNNALIATPSATVQATTTFSVAISNQCGVDTVDVTLIVFPINTTIRQDTSICITDSIVNLYATGGASYLWSPAATVDFPNQATTLARPLATTDYICTITTTEGCVTKDTTNVVVYFTPPNPILSNDLTLCAGSSLAIYAGGADEYLWSPNLYLDRIDSSVVTTSTPTDILYIVQFSNSCGSVYDSIAIDVRTPNITASNDTIVCPGNIANVAAQGGVSYNWKPAATMYTPNDQSSTVLPVAPTNYIVTGTDIYGCTDTAAVFVNLYPQPYVIASEDQFPFFGDLVPLTAAGNSSGGLYTWSPTENLSCVNCTNPTANTTVNIIYTVTFVDANDCVAKDNVKISYEPFIYIPNTFTPDENDVNNFFFAYAGNVKEFEMLIFNRWGELIWKGENLLSQWDGKFNGVVCQDGTYIWKVTYVDFNENKKTLTGHINLIR
jgi:gliding motility-associated-like protein